MNIQRLQNLFSPYLEEGETLICAVFGHQKTSVFKKPSYIGFSNRALIIMSAGFNKNGKVLRIPFKETEQVHVTERKTAFGRIYHLSVKLKNNDNTYNFTIFSHSKRLKEQRENTILFIKHVKIYLQYTFTPDSKEISEKPIRIQYCDGLLRISLFFWGLIFIPSILVTILKGQNLALTLEGLAPMGKAFIYLCTPIVVAKILNRFFLGKVIGKTYEDKVVVNNNSFPYDRIEEIVFSPAHKKHLRYGRFRNSYCAFYIKSPNDKIIMSDKYPLPAYAIREIKKHEPNIKITLPLFSKISLFFEFFALPIGLIIYCLIKL